MTLPDEIRIAKVQLGLKTAQLAEVLGVAGNTLVRWISYPDTCPYPEMLRLALAELARRASDTRGDRA